MIDKKNTGSNNIYVQKNIPISNCTRVPPEGKICDLIFLNNFESRCCFFRNDIPSTKTS